MFVAVVRAAASASVIRLCRSGNAAPTFLSLRELREDLHHQILAGFLRFLHEAAQLWLTRFLDVVG
jgi:hypothetical protein